MHWWVLAGSQGRDPAGVAGRELSGLQTSNNGIISTLLLVIWPVCWRQALHTPFLVSSPQQLAGTCQPHGLEGLLPLPPRRPTLYPSSLGRIVR